MKTEFRIRTFGRTELALRYFPNLCPDAAYRKLREWLLLNPMLRSMANSRKRSFSPKQVEEIIEQFGAP